MASSISVKNLAILLAAVIGSGGVGGWSIHRVLTPSEPEFDDGHKAIVRAINSVEAVDRSILDLAEKKLKLERRNCLALGRLGKLSDEMLDRCLD